MSRSTWKPVAMSRVYRKQLTRVANRFTTAHKLLTLACSGIKSKFGVLSYKALNFGLRRWLLYGRFRKTELVLTPRNTDAIVRLATRTLVWQNMAYGIPAKLGRYRRARMKKFYPASRYMLLGKFGEFIRTRVFYGFRVQKDKKKIEKLKKDIAKAERQHLHQRRENARLMRKAVMETRAANRKKAGAKPVKKKK